MMQKNKTVTITTMGLLTAVGLILPYATSHAFGVPGTILLPMHFPIFLMGMLCGPWWGILGGIVVPVISSLLTGMPPVYPMLPIMICELATYGGVCGWLRCRQKQHLYPTLITAMVCGRLVHGAVWSLIFLAGGKAVTFAAAFGFVVDGIPGTVLQLVLIPPIVVAVEKLMQSQELASDVSDKNTGHKVMLTGSALEEAKQLITAETASFVVIREDSIVYQDKGNGVKPIMKVLEQNPELLRDAVIADKLIGKAAAMLLSMGGAKAIYGNTMSRSAEDYLEKKRIAYDYGRCIQVVSNRTGDGICPLEKAVSDIDDEQEAYAKLKETIAKLMQAAGQ